MFGIGGSEIIVILVIALLFLGPDKLPDAAKTISKGIRDLKKQSRALQQQIENDEHIGGAIRDLKSALRGEEPPAARPPVRKQPPKLAEVPETPELPEGTVEAATHPTTDTAQHGHGDGTAASADDAKTTEPSLTLPATAGEPDMDVAYGKEEGGEDLAKLIKPASGAVVKGAQVQPEPTKSNG